MKLLFTGASGPKVASIVATVLAREHTLVGVDLAPFPHTNANLSSHIGDIRQIVDWEPFLDGVDAVVHFAALHAPHRATHSREDFLATNVEATHRLLEAARQSGASRFVLASTTSVYGRSMRTKDRAAWVTEALVPDAEDIYDETKLAAEAICRDAFSSDFATIALRFSRSFPEPPPLMAMYRLYRGVDARDVAQAFGRALAAPLDAFHAVNVSGATPFHESDCEPLMFDAPSVLRERCPGIVEEFARRGWALPTSIDRVYVIDGAKQRLGFCPEYTWQQVLDQG